MGTLKCTSHWGCMHVYFMCVKLLGINALLLVKRLVWSVYSFLPQGLHQYLLTFLLSLHHFPPLIEKRIILSACVFPVLLAMFLSIYHAHLLCLDLSLPHTLHSSLFFHQSHPLLIFVFRFYFFLAPFLHIFISLKQPTFSTLLLPFFFPVFLSVMAPSLPILSPLLLSPHIPLLLDLNPPRLFLSPHPLLCEHNLCFLYFIIPSLTLLIPFLAALTTLLPCFFFLPLSPPLPHSPCFSPSVSVAYRRIYPPDDKLLLEKYESLLSAAFQTFLARRAASLQKEMNNPLKRMKARTSLADCQTHTQTS